LAQAVCAQAGLDRRCNHLDPTSVSLSGAYVPERDAQAMTITYGDAKAHRPDVKHAVLARMVSQEGGVPFGSKSWDGNTSDIAVFQERTQALMAALQPAPRPRSLRADATLYREDNAPNLPNLGCITRIPHPIGAGSPGIAPALTSDTWPRLDDNPRYQGLELCHEGRAQRWWVVHAAAALERAEATSNNARQRETEAVDKPLFPLQAPRFKTPAMAQEALAAWAKRWTYHQVASDRVITPKHSAGKGRPTPRPPLKALEWPIQAHVRSDDDTSEHHKHVKACCVLGTHIDVSALSEAEVIAA
jgi:transposase